MVALPASEPAPTSPSRAVKPCPRGLAGQLAVVTGGGRGIGSAVAKLLAAAGARLLVVARTRAQLDETIAAIRLQGGAASGLVGDIAQERTWAEIAAAAQQAGRWDILVNAAGVTGPLGPLAEMSLPAWDDMLRVNLTGAMLGCRTALTAMLPAGQGVIINVASGLARRVQAGMAAYSASKAALVQMTAVLAAEVAPHGVQAFVIHPGIVDTQMVREQIAQASEGSDAIGRRLSTLPLLRPEFAATAFLLLASGRCSDLKGQFVQFDDPLLRSRVEELLAEWHLDRWPVA